MRGYPVHVKYPEKIRRNLRRSRSASMRRAHSSGWSVFDRESVPRCPALA
jgi:hypothetical protein